MAHWIHENMLVWYKIIFTTIGLILLEIVKLLQNSFEESFNFEEMLNTNYDESSLTLFWLRLQLGDDMSRVIGRRNVDKIGEITLTALGYSKSEECVCCPCMPASQILLFIMIGYDLTQKSQKYFEWVNAILQ
jgi:hypothetical protein